MREKVVPLLEPPTGVEQVRQLNLGLDVVGGDP